MPGWHDHLHYSGSGPGSEARSHRKGVFRRGLQDPCPYLVRGTSPRSVSPAKDLPFLSLLTGPNKAQPIQSYGSCTALTTKDDGADEEEDDDD